MEENKSYNYILPDEKNLKMSYKTEKHSMIIIGANGSGKSRLGAWIEKNDPNTTHRISAQRVLSFGTYITQRSYEQAKIYFFMGNIIQIMHMMLVGNGMEKNMTMYRPYLMTMRMYFHF